MLTGMTDVRTADAAKRLGVETTGIEIIDEADRTASPRDLFWPWFAANVSVFGISYAAFVLGFGISFWQAVVVTIIGVVVSFALCGIVSLAAALGLPAGFPYRDLILLTAFSVVLGTLVLVLTGAGVIG